MTQTFDVIVWVILGCCILYPIIGFVLAWLMGIIMHRNWEGRNDNGKGNCE